MSAYRGCLIAFKSVWNFRIDSLYPFLLFVAGPAVWCINNVGREIGVIYCVIGGYVNEEDIVGVFVAVGTEGIYVAVTLGFSVELDTVALGRGFIVALDTGFTVALDRGFTVALDRGFPLIVTSGFPVALVPDTENIGKVAPDTGIEVAVVALESDKDAKIPVGKGVSKPSL